MKKLFALLAISFLILTSCSKDETVLPITAKQNLPEVSSFKNNRAVYTYTGNKISIIDSPGKLFTFTYSGNLITKIVVKQTQGDYSDTYETVNEYDTNDRLVKEIVYTSQIATKTVYTYNSDNTIYFEMFQGDSTNQNSLYRTGVIYLNSNNEVIQKDQYLNGILSEREEYTYDNKNSVFKNIIGYNRIFSIFGYDHKIGRVNNITNCRYISYAPFNSDVSNPSEYTYNSDNYPESISTNYGNLILSEVFFYK
jgi:hypothetical protein